MRLQTRVLVNKRDEQWRRADLEITKETTIMESSNPEHSVIILNGQQMTIEVPFEQLTKMRDDTTDN